MSIYATTKRPLSMIGRMHAANAAADAKRADKEDQFNILKRRFRAELVGQSDAGAYAAKEWHALNDPIPAPSGCGGGRVHPSRARRLAEFIASEGWTDDPSAPIEPTVTLDEAIVAGTSEARARLAKAEAAMVAYETTKHSTDLDGPEPIETIVDADPAKRGPGRPRKEAFVDLAGLEGD